MKIRIKDNSVRFRLSKSEVKQLCETNHIAKQTEFANIIFHYQIQVAANAEFLSADFNNNCITLFFPKSKADTWFVDDVITHQHNMDLPNGKQLFLLLEKDFVCLDHTHEDQSDNYQNPNKTC
jgi:hypothetical protein